MERTNEPMSNTLQVKVSPKKSGTDEWYEGTVSISGLKPTKLARKSDGSTRFTSRSAVSGAARNLAKSLGFTDVDFGETTSKKAAKKSVKKSVKKASSSTTTSTSSAS